MDEQTIQHAEAALQDLDPVMKRLVTTRSLQRRPVRENYFQSLTRSIIGQQVSVAAANAIYKRFEVATAMQPETVVQLTQEDSKAIGLSKQKYGYITDLAHHFIENPDRYNHLDQLSDEEVINDLVAVKGIGVWTAQMFMMHTLGRPDVFAPDDVGLQRAIVELYDFETVPPRKVLVTFAEQWKPYRTVASWHLWQSLDNDPDFA